MKSNKIYKAALPIMLLMLVGTDCVAAAEAGAVQERSIVAESEDKTLDESWRIAADARIEVDNVRGRLDVSGWDKAEVALSGTLGEGSTLAISGDAQHLMLRVGGTRNGRLGGNGPDSDSELVLRVPRAVALKLGVVSADANIVGIVGKSLEASSVSGTLVLSSAAADIEINSVSGEVRFVASAPNVVTQAHLQTVSGDIDAKGLSGRVKLETVSGNIGLDGTQVQELETGTVSGDATIRIAPAAHGRLRFESMSGDISVHLPTALSAHLDAATFSGSIGSDYGTVQEKEHGPGSNLDARVGDGDAQIHAESFSGDIELRKQ